MSSNNDNSTKSIPPSLVTINNNHYNTLDYWLKKNAAWNTSKTVARCSIFLSPPQSLLIPNKNNDDDDDDDTNDDTDYKDNGKVIKNGKTCRTCSLIFDDVISQQQHFKSTLHRLLSIYLSIYHSIYHNNSS
jgi:hypothetical protein